MLDEGEGRTFYAVGGTWRALARLHMWQIGYPFHVMHNYRIPAREALEFSRLVHRVDTETLSKIEVVNAARRPLLAYAALVMENLVRVIKPKEVVISVLGVREGLLYSLLKQSERARDPLIQAAADLNVLRSRSPHHGEELIAWTDRFMASTGIEETRDERRLRHAACLLGDIGWRAHPDYRGEQSMNIIANGAFIAIDHPGRAYLALSVYFRHAGLSEEELSPRLRELATTRMLDRARVLGAAMRVAYILTAGQSGVLPKTPMQVKRGKLILKLPGRFARLRARAAVQPAAATGAPGRPRAGDRRLGLYPTVTTRPRSTASASLPCLSASAFSPNSSRRQPFSAGTSASSSAAMRSRSSTVAITLAATPCRSEVMRSSTLSSSTVAAPFGAGRKRSSCGSVLGSRASPRLTASTICLAPARALEALRQRAQRAQPLDGGRRLHRDVADHVVLEHARARHVARLRLALAPGRDLDQHGELLRLAHAGFQPLPGALRAPCGRSRARSARPSRPRPSRRGRACRDRRRA